jgi:hypothetical protein
MSYAKLIALSSWLLVPVGGRRFQRPGPSSTIGSFGPSHHRCHKSRVSFRGSPCAHGVSGIPFGEVRNTSCHGNVCQFYHSFTIMAHHIAHHVHRIAPLIDHVSFEEMSLRMRSTLFISQSLRLSATFNVPDFNVICNVSSFVVNDLAIANCVLMDFGINNY